SRPRTFNNVDPGMGGYLARHELAIVYLKQGRWRDAETQWQTVLTDRPDFSAARVGLGEVFLAQGRWDELEQVLRHLESEPKHAADVAGLRARAETRRSQR